MFCGTACRRLAVGVVAVVFGVSGGSGVASAAEESDPSVSARQELISILQRDPDKAPTASSYQTRDSTGFTVDTIKVIRSPAGGYLGVYHVNKSETFDVRVATSSDLINWTYRATLAQRGHDPTIRQLSDGSFLLAYEKVDLVGTHLPFVESGGTHLRFAHYSRLETLLVNLPQRTFDAPRTLSSTYEGTPNIRSASLSGGLGSSQIKIGFHYNSRDGDREALGTLTNFSDWKAEKNESLNDAFSPTPADIGDRDFVNFRGYPFTVVEARTARDWGSWRVYLYDETAKTLTQLALQTPGGCQSFANPAVTSLRDPSGNRALATTYYVHAGPNGAACPAASAPGESGPLVFYTPY